MELLLSALSTGMWMLGSDRVTDVPLAEAMLTFVYEHAEQYFGACCVVAWRQAEVSLLTCICARALPLSQAWGS